MQIPLLLINPKSSLPLFIIGRGDAYEAFFWLFDFWPLPRPWKLETFVR